MLVSFREGINSNLSACFWRCIWYGYNYSPYICEVQKHNTSRWPQPREVLKTVHCTQINTCELLITEIWYQPQPSTPNPRLNPIIQMYQDIKPSKHVLVPISTSFFAKNNPTWWKKTPFCFTNASQNFGVFVAKKRVFCRQVEAHVLTKDHEMPPRKHHRGGWISCHGLETLVFREKIWVSIDPFRETCWFISCSYRYNVLVLSIVNM